VYIFLLLFVCLFWLHWVFIVTGELSVPVHGLLLWCTGLGVALQPWDLSSPTKYQTHISCIGRQILNQWTTREVSYTFFFFFFINLTLEHSWWTQHCSASGIQERDSVIRVPVSIFFFKFFSHSAYYRILSQVPCAVQDTLIGYLFIYFIIIFLI